MSCSDAVSWNLCSRFKQCVMHSAIRSPEFNPIGPIDLRAVGDDLDRRLGTHHFNLAVSSASA
jgi:hypothetical protein